MDGRTRGGRAEKRDIQMDRKTAYTIFSFLTFTIRGLFDIPMQTQSTKILISAYLIQNNI